MQQRLEEQLEKQQEQVQQQQEQVQQQQEQVQQQQQTEDEDEEASAVGMGRRLSSGIRSEGGREYATAQKEYALQRAAEEERERVRLEEVVWRAAYCCMPDACC
jgi:hypothetical protein